MDLPGGQTKQLLADFLAKLDEIDDYEADQLTPLVLELTGRLGTLNRLAMHLLQSAIIEGTALQKSAQAGDANASSEFERLKLGLRETSQRIEQDLMQIHAKLTLLHDSLEISGQILDYIGRVRTLLTEAVWK